jgi:hypothetical protein
MVMCAAVAAVDITSGTVADGRCALSNLNAPNLNAEHAAIWARHIIDHGHALAAILNKELGRLNPRAPKLLVCCSVVRRAFIFPMLYRL